VLPRMNSQGDRGVGKYGEKGRGWGSMKISRAKQIKRGENRRGRETRGRFDKAGRLKKTNSASEGKDAEGTGTPASRGRKCQAKYLLMGS